MPLDKLIGTLVADAERQIEQELGAARAEAAATTAASNRKIEARRREAQAAHERDSRSAVELGLSDTRREARRCVLEARRRLLDRVFAAARERFPETLNDPGYRAGLPGSVAEALACMGSRPVTLRCPSELKEDLEHIAGNRKIRVALDPVARSGFRAVTEDGSLEVDATLETRLTALAPVLTLEVLQRLEPRR